MTDPTGVRQFFFYDEADRKVGQVDGDGTLTEFVYDKASQLIKTIQYSVLLSGTRLASLVDGSGNPTAVTLATCRTEAGTSAGHRPGDVAMCTTWLARLVYTIDAIGAVTQINYDGAGRVTETIEYANTIAVPRATDQVLPVDLTSTSSPFKIVPNAAKDRRTRVFYDNEGNQIGSLDAAGYIIENRLRQRGTPETDTPRTRTSRARACGRAEPGRSSRLPPAPIPRRPPIRSVTAPPTSTTTDRAARSASSMAKGI